MISGTPFIIRFAERVLSEDHHCLIGDIEWSYRSMLEERGSLAAGSWLWYSILTLVPRLFLRDLIWQHTMLKNYLLVAIRQFRKFKAFSLINVFGLALSMSVCLLILTLVSDFRSDDGFHENADKIVRIISKVSEYWGKFEMATSAVMLGPELLREMDDVEDLVQLRKTSGKLTRDDGRMAQMSGLYAQDTFFKFFDFEFALGNPETALSNPFQMVISEELAQRLFPDRDPIGELVDRETGTYEVTGVLSDTPGRTHLEFDALFSFATLPSLFASQEVNPLDSWEVNTRFYNYLMLADGASLSRIREVANRMGAEHHTSTENEPAQYALQPLAAISLGKDLSNEIGDVLPSLVAWIMSAFAFLLIGTAAFNYINLTVSRALKRREEIGVRKVVGAHRRQLVQQFVTEAIVTSLLSLGLAWILLQWMIPQFNSLGPFAESGKQITMSSFDPILIFKFLAFSLLLGIIAGILPALKISRQSPVAAFKGPAISQNGVRFFGRKAIVVFQFGLSMIAIVTVAVVYQQSGFLMASDIGFDSEQLLHVRLSDTEHENFANQVRRVPGIVKVGALSAPPSTGSNTSVDIKTPEMENPMMVGRYAVDENFLDQYNIELLAGRNFSPGREADQFESVILTEAAVVALGLGTPVEAVGQILEYDTYSYELDVAVIGVVSDFYSRGYDGGYYPESLAMRPEMYSALSIRLAAGNPQPVLAELEALWAQHAPGLPFNYEFMDDTIEARLSHMQDNIALLGTFAFMIVIIACLGLLGMAMFTVETRLKEVGIRKTLGADAWTIVGLLSREYLVLVGVAVIIAGPLAFILNSLILSGFANRIELGLGTILLGVIPVLMLALVTIGSQTLKAASTNPIDVMRTE